MAADSGRLPCCINAALALAGSFAELARQADQARDTMLVPKTALETPPLEIHTLGDEVLRQIAVVLRENCRGSDVACRFGGDEFVVALFDITPEQVKGRAESIRDLAGRIRAPGPLRGDTLSISVGIALYPDDGSVEEELLGAADRALYRAKLAGRNCICVGGGEDPDARPRLKVLA